MTNPASPKHVFMSYSRRDEAAMQRIAAFLRKQSINVWVDNEKLVPGTPIWEVEIEKAIKNASAVIVILSPDSKDSEWVRREISLADQYHTRIFPVLVHGDEESSITLRLITRQYVDIRRNEDVGLDSLRVALSLYLEGLEAQGRRAKEEADVLAREKAEREIAEKAAREKDERERLAKEKEEAERLAAQKVEKEQQEREKAKEAGVLHYKGMLAQKEGKYGEAELLFRQSLAIAVHLKDEQGKANILHQLAILTQERQTKEKAESEAAERVAREKDEREAAEKAAREKAEREATEKAAREKAEREAADKAARERATKLEEFKRKEAERLAREKAAREIAAQEAAEKTALEKANRAESYIGAILGAGLALFYLFIYGENFVDAIPLAILLIIVVYFSVRIAFPHKISVIFLIIGFFIAGLKLETDLSEYPENFILLGGIVGLPAGAILSWVLALGKVLK